MMDMISIIIPVYNVENYIEKCLDSVIRQTYKDIEIILVNDGSSDNSGKICRKYAAMDSRIKILEKENGGLSSARNAGIDIASGKYITFIDSDDFVSQNYIEYLYEIMKNNNADISICSYKRVFEGENPELEDVQKECLIMGKYRALATLLYQKKFTASAWAKMYKKNLWRDIRFPAGKLHEDVAVMYLLFSKAKTVVYGDKKLYYYLQRNGSIVNSCFNPKRMDYIVHTQKCMDYMQEKYSMLYKAAVSRHFSACCELLSEIPDGVQYDIYREKLYAEIRKYRHIVCFDKYARMINRGAAIGSYISLKAVIWGCIHINRKRKKAGVNHAPSPKEVLVVGTTDPVGGVGQVIKTLCTGIDASTAHFDFLYYEEPTEKAKKYIRELGGQYFVVPRYSKHPVRFLFKTMKIYKRKTYDYVHIHASTGMLIMYAIPVWFSKKTKIIYQSHIDYATPVWMHKIFKKIVCRVCDYYIAVSEQAARWMYTVRIIHSNKFFIIRNGIDINKFLFNKEKRDNIRRELGVDGKFILGHVGRFTEQKNHLQILDIFCEVYKRNENSVLLLVGDGPLIETVKQKAEKLNLSDVVIFYGTTDHVEDLVQAMDIFLFPSKWEGLGIVAVEAQAADLPVIASDNVPQEAKILDKFEYCSLKESDGKWAELILKYSATKERKNQYSAIKSAGYSAETSVRQVERLYSGEMKK